MSEFLDNQFTPVRMAEALQTALQDDLFAASSDAAKQRVTELLVTGIQSKIFAYNGPVSFQSYRKWSDAETRDAFIFYPLTAGERFVSLTATTNFSSPEIYFREEEEGATPFARKFESTIAMDITRRISLKRRTTSYEPYDPVKNPHKTVYKFVNAYDRVVHDLPVLSRIDDADHPSLGLQAFVKYKRNKRKVERRTVSYRHIKSMVRAIVSEHGDSAEPEIAAIFKNLARFESGIAIALRSDMLSRFEEGWQAYKSQLDPNALSHMERIGLSNLQVYSRVAYAEPGPIMQFRANAFQVFARLGLDAALVAHRTRDVIKPYEDVGLQDDLVERYDGEDYDGQKVRELIPFWNSIDSGMPAFEALKLYNQNVAEWRRIARLPVVPPRTIAELMFEEKRKLPIFTELALLAPPKSKADWYDLKDFYEEVTKLFTSRHGDLISPPDEILDFIRRSRRGLQETPATWAAFYKASIDKRGDCGAMNDTLRSLEEYVLGPVLARADCDHARLKTQFKKKILNRYNLNHLRAASDYWHSERVRFKERLGSFVISGDQQWEALVKDVVSPKGIQFHALISKPQLQEEADIMLHCVWSYTDDCTSGKSHILSLRNAEGHRLSTLELQETQDGKVRVKQNEAYKREAPSAEAQEAALWLVGEINAGRIQPDYEKIQQKRAEFRKQKASSKLGFDVDDLNKCEEIFMLYHPCLPPRVRERIGCVADFFDAIGFDEDLKEVGIAMPSKPLQSYRPVRPKKEASDEPPSP